MSLVTNEPLGTLFDAAVGPLLVLASLLFVSLVLNRLYSLVGV